MVGQLETREETRGSVQPVWIGKSGAAAQPAEEIVETRVRNNDGDNAVRYQSLP